MISDPEYTSQRISPTRKTYAGSNGAVMIFKDPDYRGLNVWRPNIDEWNQLTATWFDLPLNDISLPRDYKTADVVIGPVSIGQTMVRHRKQFLTQGTDIQHVFVSYRGCERLRDSLVTIVYIEN